MLPIASVSLRRRTHSTLLNFSGSSVASGATNSENASGGMPAASPRVLTAPTKISAPSTIRPSAIATCTKGAAVGSIGGPLGQAADHTAHPRPHVQRVDLVGHLPLELALAGALEVSADVVAVAHHQHDRERVVDRFDVQQARDDGERVHHEEVAEILADHARIDLEGPLPPPAAGEDQDRHRDHHHRERRQHERRADDRADPDLLARGVARRDRDDRQDRLGQRGADGGEHRPDRALGQSETLAHPFDAVREQLRARQDHEQRHDQQRPIHMGVHAPRAC